MVEKKVNFQHVYDLTDEFPYYAYNSQGILHGFKNAPVRNFQFEEWIDSVTGDTGTCIPYTRWDVSVRKFDDLTDAAKLAPGVRKKQEALENTGEVAEKRKELGFVNGATSSYSRIRKAETGRENLKRQREKKNAIN